jgi:hypothetical protein
VVAFPAAAQRRLGNVMGSALGRAAKLRCGIDCQLSRKEDTALEQAMVVASHRRTSWLVRARGVPRSADPVPPGGVRAGYRPAMANKRARDHRIER